MIAIIIAPTIHIAIPIILVTSCFLIFIPPKNNPVSLVYHIFTNYASAYTRLRKIFYNVLEVSKMSVKDAVAERFLELCHEKNIKINELANRAGVTPSTAYSMLDTRRRDISIVTIKKFCDGLDISLGEFFSAEVFDSLMQEIE